jgi:uncharacterized protein
VIVADTGAVLALLDAGDAHHSEILELYDRDPDAWVLPWAILPEIDYLLATHVSALAEEVFLADLAEGRFTVEWADDEDLKAACRIAARYESLPLGVVDAAVIALAERRRAHAIATLDIRHFGAVEIAGAPLLLPRDATRVSGRPSPARRRPRARRSRT